MNNKKSKLMGKSTDDKAFHFRMPKDTWLLLKNAAIINECTMGELVVKCLEKNRKKLTGKIVESENIEQ